MSSIKRMAYTDTDYNGNTWPPVWVDTYNRLTEQLERTQSLSSRERIMNERHAFFVTCVAAAYQFSKRNNDWRE